MGATYNAGGPGYSQLLTFNQAFTCDGLNRLTAANETGGWSRSFAYDAYGNMTPSGTPAPPTVSFNGNNQIVGQQYDQAGNVLAANGNKLGYDFEGRITSEQDGQNQAVETYVFDADGKRVQKYGPSGTARIVYAYDAMGRMAAEYSTVAEAPSCITCYLSADHLGTTRLITDQNGLVVARHDFLPFGEEVQGNTFGRDSHWGSGNDSINQKFTGKERDSESGLDWWSSRYYGSALGRFTSPDPIGFGGAKLFDPQSWNQYAYARNNPLLYTDPDGFSYEICDANGKNCAKQQLSDDDFAKEKKGAKASGETFRGSTFSHVDENGNKVVDGTYRQTDVDLDSRGASVIQGLGARADASNKLLGIFAGGAVVVGGTGGLIAAYAPELLGAGAEAETAEASSIESDVGAGLRRQIDLHKQKLADYIKNPDAYDIKGF